MCFNLAILSYIPVKDSLNFYTMMDHLKHCIRIVKDPILNSLKIIAMKNISLIDLDFSKDKLNRRDIVCELEQNEDGSLELCSNLNIKVNEFINKSV